MNLFSTENQPINRKSRKGIKNKKTILREQYHDIFTDDQLAINPVEIIKEVVTQLLSKEKLNINELELLFKVGITYLPFTPFIANKEPIAPKDDIVYVASTQEILEKFQGGTSHGQED